MNSSQLESLNNLSKMAFISPNYTKSYKVRSISFPARSSGQVQDTITLSEDLGKLKSWLAIPPPQTDTIGASLEGLNQLYSTMRELLVNSPQTLKALSNSQYKNWVTEMIDESIIYVDICGKARDSICEMSECTGELQSALRRKKGNEIDIASNVEGYMRLRKNMKKSMEKSLLELKQMENNFRNLFSDKVANDQLLEMVRVLREASSVTNVIFQKLLTFLSIPRVKPKSSRWSLAKLMTKGADNVQERIKNEFEDVDIEVMNLPIQSSMRVCEDDQSVNLTLEKLESLDMSMKAFELGLENLFKNLIYMRVTYLNICSQ